MATALDELDTEAEAREGARESDPTLRAVARFDDESQWQNLRDVPVFTEHDELDEDKDSPTYGKVKKHFGPEELQAIADNCNRRFRSTGDPCPLTLGHTLPGRPEPEQPEIVGYALNFRVGTFGPESKTAIICDWYFYADVDLDKVLRKFPRRSVELFPRDNVFDPIALLSRTPELDMGLTIDYAKRERAKLYKRMERQSLRYHFHDWQAGQRCLRFSFETKGDTMAANELPKEDQDKADRYLKHYLKHDPVLKHAADELGLEDEDDGGLSMKEQYHARRFMKHYARYGKMGGARKRFMAQNVGDEKLVKHYAAETDDEELTSDEEAVAEKYWRYQSDHPAVKYALGEDDDPQLPPEAGDQVGEPAPEPPVEGATAADAPPAPDAPEAPVAPVAEGTEGTGTEGDDLLKDEHGDLPPEHQYTATRYFKHAMRTDPVMYAMYKRHHAEHYAAGGPGAAAAPAAPSGTNTVVPDHEGGEGAGTPVPRKEEADQMAAKTEAIKYAREQQGLAVRVANLEKANQELRTELQKERYEKKRAQCESVISQLAGEGYDLDAKEELAEMVKLDDAGRAAYEAKIRKRYSKAPIADGHDFHPADVADEEAVQKIRTETSDKFGKRELAQATEYALANPNVAWKDVVEKFKQKKSA